MDIPGSKKETLLPAHSSKGFCVQSGLWSYRGGNLSQTKFRQYFWEKGSSLARNTMNSKMTVWQWGISSGNISVLVWFNSPFWENSKFCWKLFFSSKSWIWVEGRKKNTVFYLFTFYLIFLSSVSPQISLSDSELESWSFPKAGTIFCIETKEELIRLLEAETRYTQKPT